MDCELTAVGCMRLAESTPEEREKATENVLKNLDYKVDYVCVVNPTSVFIKKKYLLLTYLIKFIFLY